MYFNLISDLHLEYYQSLNEIQHLLKAIKKHQTSRMLCLLGDIGNPIHHLYSEFLSEMTQLYQYVIVIAGNHEYYHHGKTVEEIDNHIHTLCENMNSQSKKGTLFFLQKTTVNLFGYRLIGCTLWSPISDASKATAISSDYANIINYDSNGNKRKIDYHDHNCWHQNHLDWIREEIQSAQKSGQKLIVLTHHSPITFAESIPPPFRGNRYQEGFCTDLADLLCPPVICWCYGHTHYPYTCKYKGITIQCNSVGGIKHFNHSIWKSMKCEI